MPVHDWTRVDAGIFHHFHFVWIGALAGVLNRGLLPHDYYAMAEQTTGGLGPDVPSLQLSLRAEAGWYAAKANTIVIRHVSNHPIVAMVELVSPGNKNSRHGLRSFVEKAVYVLRGGIHLVIVDLFPPGTRDPQGLHKAIWDEFIDSDFELPEEKRLTLASYIARPFPEAFIEPTTVGASLPELPLFLTPEVYVPLPLEPTYQSAWDAVPSFWQDVLTAPGSS
jgi:Protein of unknown function (DUF4058)